MTANLFIALWVMGFLIWWSYRIGAAWGRRSRADDEWRDGLKRRLDEKLARIEALEREEYLKWRGHYWADAIEAQAEEARRRSQRLQDRMDWADRMGKSF